MLNCLARLPQCQLAHTQAKRSLNSLNDDSPSAEASTLSAETVQDRGEPSPLPPPVCFPFVFEPQPSSSRPPDWKAMASYSLTLRCTHRPAPRESRRYQETGRKPASLGHSRCCRRASGPIATRADKAAKLRSPCQPWPEARHR